MDKITITQIIILFNLYIFGIGFTTIFQISRLNGFPESGLQKFLTIFFSVFFPVFWILFGIWKLFKINKPKNDSQF